MIVLAEVAHKIDEIKEKNSDMVFGGCRNQLLAKSLIPNP
jgi:hypothetical protein